ncbi:MAG: hypothetical protein MJZ34_02830 [Paludibacteraceae bacterium]|nr:hypothetical protein [Paludibacteraceae bacterium]
MKFTKCEFCEQTFSNNTLKKHLMNTHQKTLRENTFLREHLTEETVPKCPYCEKHVAVENEIEKTCGDAECKKKLHHDNLVEGGKKAAKTQFANGSHPFQHIEHKGIRHVSKGILNLEQVKCEFCGKNITKKRIADHLLKIHQHTLAENTMLREGITLNDIPKCKFCGEPVEIDHIVHEVCSSTTCKEALKHEHRSLQVSKQQKQLALEGRHSFTSEHVTQLNQKRLAEGTHNFLAGNFDPESRSRLVSRRNVTVYSDEKYIQHYEDFNKEFIVEHFLDKEKDRFNLWKAVDYFQCNYQRIQRARFSWGILCPNVSSGHYLQNQVYDFVKDNYAGEILCNTRQIITPLELDVYLPDIKLAIEFDGYAYHSIGKCTDGYHPWTNIEQFDKNYHRNKNDACEKQGIQLLHIFEGEWLDPVKRDIWKSVISSHLGINKRVYARKCRIEEIESKVSEEFLNENHLQGNAPGSICLGLYLGEELVSVMTFCKSRYDSGYTYELLRYCNKKFVNVIGGAGKLLSYFRKNYEGSILSYANRRWSTGNLYKSLGFQDKGPTDLNYFYIDMETMKLLSRVSCQKWKLKEKLKDKYDDSLSETENMINAGYRKIYDCGNLKYTLN